MKHKFLIRFQGIRSIGSGKYEPRLTQQKFLMYEYGKRMQNWRASSIWAFSVSTLSPSSPTPAGRYSAREPEREAKFHPVLKVTYFASTSFICTRKLHENDESCIELFCWMNLIGFRLLVLIRVMKGALWSGDCERCVVYHDSFN